MIERKCAICEMCLPSIPKDGILRRKYCSQECASKGEYENRKGYTNVWLKNNKEYYKKYKKEYNKNNAQHKRLWELKKKYDIIPKQYNEMLENQDNCCAICKKHKSNFKKGLFIDHNHITNKVRGLLCGKCNFILGNADDSVDILKSSMLYLEKHNSY